MKPRILIVEDHPVYANGLINYLKSKYSHFEYHHVKSGASALKTINLNLFKILVIDINLPDMSGIELIQILKNKHCNSKIITNSYDYLLYDLAQLVKLNVDGILLKGDELNIWDQSLKHILENKHFHSSEIKTKIDTYIDMHTHGSLTESEVSVIKLICKGYNTDKIAEIRGVSINTINTHKKNIFTKFEVHNAVELAVIAIKKGIV